MKSWHFCCFQPTIVKLIKFTQWFEKIMKHANNRKVEVYSSISVVGMAFWYCVYILFLMLLDVWVSPTTFWQMCLEYSCDRRQIEKFNLIFGKERYNLRVKHRCRLFWNDMCGKKTWVKIDFQTIFLVSSLNCNTNTLFGELMICCIPIYCGHKWTCMCPVNSAIAWLRASNSGWGVWLSGSDENLGFDATRLAASGWLRAGD